MTQSGTTDQIRTISGAVVLTDLFRYRDVFQTEIEKRSREVLQAMGYEWHKLHSINAALSMRGKIQIISIKAAIQHNYEDSVIEAEMPVKQFEMLLKTDFAS
jgi:hypothetical protein